MVFYSTSPLQNIHTSQTLEHVITGMWHVSRLRPCVFYLFIRDLKVYVPEQQLELGAAPLEMQILRLHPDLLTPKALWEWSPAICVLKSPSGDPNALKFENLCPSISGKKSMPKLLLLLEVLIPVGCPYIVYYLRVIN